jgi:hypothetical protein
VILSAAIVVAVVAMSESPAAAAGCDRDQREVTNARFRGLVVVCLSGSGVALEIQNISRITYRIWAADSSVLFIRANPDNTLLGEATRRAAPARCCDSFYTLQPGGSASVVALGAGVAPQAFLDPDAQRTALTLAARLVAGQIERGLRPRARRNMEAVMACARAVTSTSWQDGWDYAFRQSVDLATTCPSLVQRVLSSPEEEQTLARKITSLGRRIASQEGFVDIVLSAAKAIIRRY